MHYFTNAIRKSPGAGFGYAREGSRKVGVVLHRHQPIKREHADRRIAAGLIARFFVRAPAAGQRIDHCFDAKRFCYRQLDLFGLDVASAAYT